MKKTLIPFIFAVLMPLCASARSKPAQTPAPTPEPTPEPMSQNGDMLLFDFGAEPEYGWVQVSEKTKYTKDSGYGFSTVSFIENADTPAASGVVSDAIKIDHQYCGLTEFKADMPEGIYEIAIYTGMIRYMNISLEGYPALFEINDSCSEARIEIPVTDGTLNMQLMTGIWGTELSVSAITITRKSQVSERRRRVFICGDSIASTSYPLLLDPPYEKTCRGGWGQMLGAYLPDDIYVHNISSPGASAATYLAESTIEERLHFAEKGDIVIISLGINDRNSVTEYEYRKELNNLARRIRVLDCEPVLCSDSARLLEYHGDSYIDLCYAAATKRAARTLRAKYIDLHAAYAEHLCDTDYKDVPDLFLHLWNGSIDLTHPNRTGADIMARLVAERLIETGLLAD